MNFFFWQKKLYHTTWYKDFGTAQAKVPSESISRTHEIYENISERASLRHSLYPKIYIKCHGRLIWNWSVSGTWLKAWNGHDSIWRRQSVYEKSPCGGYLFTYTGTDKRKVSKVAVQSLDCYCARSELLSASIADALLFVNILVSGIFHGHFAQR